MIFSFAPMEGVTTAPFRQVHAALFPGVSRYYAPFLAPDGQGNCRRGQILDLLPENNPRGLPIPQILCNRPEPFLLVAKELAAMGYREVNLNTGCPSPIVTPKHKGAGMLTDLQSLDDFLSEIFACCPLKISVKTRMGFSSTAEFPAIMSLYNRYPFTEIIVHARDRAGMYQSVPDLEGFAAALPENRIPLCYNGNINGPEALSRVTARCPELDHVMIGRAAVANPALFRVLQGGAPLEAKEFQDFLERLLQEMQSRGLTEHHMLARLKELWYYTIWMFPGSRKGAKAIKKAQNLEEYRTAVTALFADGAFSPEARFSG